MTRNLVIIGLIAGFIASAFVTPTNANFKAMQALAKDQVRVRTAGSLLGGSVLSAKDAQTAAKVLAAVAANPALKSSVAKAVGSAVSLKNVEEAATVLTSVSSPVKTVKRVAASAAQILTTHRLTSVWKTFKASADPFTVAQMERIEWALRKGDVRLCSDVMDSADNRSDKDPQTLTSGEYLALCVAIVTGDPARCDQILSVSDPSLRSLCSDELAVI